MVPPVWIHRVAGFAFIVMGVLLVIGRLKQRFAVIPVGRRIEGMLAPGDRLIRQICHGALVRTANLEVSRLVTLLIGSRTSQTPNNRKRGIMRLRVLAVAVAVFLLASLNGFAKDDEGRWQVDASNKDRPCGARSLHGTYGNSFQFLNQDPGMAGQPIDDRTHTPGAGIGLITFDGKGTWSARTTLSASGFVVRYPSSGTYVVNADCTGTRQIDDSGNPPTIFEFVIVDNGQEVFELSTRPGDVAIGRWKKR
jgi:hypothetical protein